MMQAGYTVLEHAAFTGHLDREGQMDWYMHCRWGWGFLFVTRRPPSQEPSLGPGPRLQNGRGVTMGRADGEGRGFVCKASLKTPLSGRISAQACDAPECSIIPGIFCPKPSVSWWISSLVVIWISFSKKNFSQFPRISKVKYGIFHNVGATISGILF